MAVGDVDLGVLSSPSELKAAADRINAEVQAIDDAIDGNEAIPQALFDSWNAFWSRWKAFYNQNFDSPVWSWLTTRLGSLADQLETWTADAKNYATQFRQYDVEIPGGVLSVDPGFSLSDSLKSLASGYGFGFGTVVVLLIVGVFIYYKVLKP